MARGGGGGRRVKGPTLPPSTLARARAREAIGNQRPWPADRVERWAIERLIPYAKNARTHTDAQIAAIAASIKEWGWTSPALVGEAWRPNRGPRQGARCPAAGHRRDPGDGRGGLERGAKARLRARRQSAGDYRLGVGPGAAAARTRRAAARSPRIASSPFPTQPPQEPSLEQQLDAAQIFLLVIAADICKGEHDQGKPRWARDQLF